MRQRTGRREDDAAGETSRTGTSVCDKRAGVTKRPCERAITRHRSARRCARRASSFSARAQSALSPGCNALAACDASAACGASAACDALAACDASAACGASVACDASAACGRRDPFSSVRPSFSSRRRRLLVLITTGHGGALATRASAHRRRPSRNLHNYLRGVAAVLLRRRLVCAEAGRRQRVRCTLSGGWFLVKRCVCLLPRRSHASFVWTRRASCVTRLVTGDETRVA